MLIDPVCLMTCCPQLLHSFIYKVPAWGWAMLTTPTGFMDLLRFIISRDLMVAEVRLSCPHSPMQNTNYKLVILFQLISAGLGCALLVSAHLSSSQFISVLLVLC